MNWRVAQGLHRSYNDCLREETSYKMQRPSQISLIAHTAKITAKILRRTERKTEGVLEDQFGFRQGKGTRDAIGMVRISERTLKIDEGCWTSHQTDY
jgi:hypothetical protein